MKFLLMTTLFIFTTQVFAQTEKLIDREVVRQVIRTNLSSIKNCYSDRLKTNPELEGKIVVEWDISRDGSVSKASVKSSTLKDEVVENCVIDKIKSLKFPIPPNGRTANISYPFGFSKNK